MKDIRRQLLILSLYLILTFNLERLDLNGQTLINFRPYFYALVIAGVLSMLVFPVLQKTSIYILLALWGTAYTSLWLFYSQEKGLAYNLQIVIIQFVFLEAAIWMTYELTNKINQTEATLNTMIGDIFPNRVMELSTATKWIDNEMSRSRRHSAPLSVLILDQKGIQVSEQHPFFERLQQDILERLAMARASQILSECVRQSDIIIRSETNKFIVVMPNTDADDSRATAARLQEALHGRIGSTMNWGVASFPEEALTFEDLVSKAQTNLAAGERISFPISQPIASRRDDKQ